MTATERADKIMCDWFGHRWNESEQLNNVWLAIRDAIEATDTPTICYWDQPLEKLMCPKHGGNIRDCPYVSHLAKAASNTLPKPQAPDSI